MALERAAHSSEEDVFRPTHPGYNLLWARVPSTTTGQDAIDYRIAIETIPRIRPFREPSDKRSEASGVNDDGDLPCYFCPLGK